jgi:beta-glucosidase
LAQTPRPKLPGLGTPWGTPTRIEYNEGAEVGYRWYAKTNVAPLFPFGYGLSYTSFALSDLTVSSGDTISATFTVTNTGNRDGADVPQLYLTDAAGEKRMRLLGFERVELRPGEKRNVTLKAEPRLIAHFDGSTEQWRVTAGTYHVAVGESAADLKLTADVPLQGRLFGQ